MTRRQRALLLVFWALNVTVLLAFLLAPVRPLTDMRRDLANGLLDAGWTWGARQLYATLTWAGEAVDLNNYAVLLRQKAWSLPRDARATRFNLSDEASALLEKAIALRLDAAAYNMGMLGYKADRETLAYEYTKGWLRPLADKGDALAARAYALHLTRWREHPDSEERVERLRGLVAQGDLVATEELAEEIRGEDREGSVRLLRVAAEAGSMQAMEHLSVGIGNLSPFDTEDWIYWTTRSAEAGSRHSQLRLGTVYREGWRDIGVDYVKARYWLKVALTGRNVAPWPSRDFTREADGFRVLPRNTRRMAADGAGISAALHLARMHVQGEGGPVNRFLAMIYYTVPVASGDYQALAELRELRRH